MLSVPSHELKEQEERPEGSSTLKAASMAPQGIGVMAPLK
jgi:hypothetical protein